MLRSWCLGITALYVLCQTEFSDAEPTIGKCPIGFKLSLTESNGDLICYRRKGPEYFEDVYHDCIGNLFTSKLYYDLNLIEPEVIWTEYRSYYPGGLFIDTSHTKSFGDEFNLTNIKTYNNLDIHEEWCIVIDPVNKFTAVKCDEKLYRYCFVKPYPSAEDMSHEGCNDLKDSFRFRSPESTCVKAFALIRNGWANLGQAQEICRDRGLQGSIYANNPIVQYNSKAITITVPRRKTYFDKLLHNNLTQNLVCGHHVPLRNLGMNITINYSDNKLIISINETIDEDDIMCYTDALFRYPMRISIKRKENNTYILNESKNGYYWCTHKDIMNFAPAETNKVLYIKNTSSVKHLYAIKLRLNEKYDLSTLYNLRIEYLFYKFQHEKANGELGANNAEDTSNVKTTSQRNPELDVKNVSHVLTVKRAYLDLQTVLMHITFERNSKMVLPGTWKGMEVLSVKSVYYCAGFNSVPDTPLGQSVKISGCETHTCVGDFNEGVEWMTVNCTTSPPNTIKNANNTLTTTLRTESREEQLRQVLDNLDRLANNSHIFVSDIDDVFDQVNGILEIHDELKIPGKLLYFLDQLGSKAVLSETGFGSVIKSNIALFMVDAQPTNPVWGFRIPSNVYNGDTGDAFEFLTEEPNSTVLNLEESEVVVNLPPSVSEFQRRVSFVVFRNDRAFQAESLYMVNSRVVSVNIENVTHFYGGEVLDIHLRPIKTELERNESRSCAYWHFFENGTGYWSQEGCTFIRATEQGMLDTCRCDHLTHFAEVLVPRAVFSEANENALEIITIVGCFLSLVGLLIIGVTALLFRSWRREYSNIIWLQLCIAIFILVLSFLFVIFIHFDHYDVTCLLIGVTLHYAVLASFCWMLVAAILAYRKLVLVFSRDPSHKLLKAAAFSWGAPCVIVGILLSVSPLSYAGLFEEMTPSGSFCYPSGLGFWLTVFAPIATVLLTNWILFALIFRSVFVSRRTQRYGETNEVLRCASVSCMLVFLFGLPWIFGLFASNVVAVYLFTLTATFQGFILFVFLILGNKQTKDLWLNMLKIRPTKKVLESTCTNRSEERNAGNPQIFL